MTRQVYKQLFPFRIGTTSYVYPDEILPNVEKLAPVVDDIELVLFESGPETNIPGAELVCRLDEIARSNAITYTVHFPIDLKAGSPDKLERENYANRAAAIAERMAPLKPFAYVMHFEGIEANAPPPIVGQWQDCVRDTLDRMRKLAVPLNEICVENLNYPCMWHKGIAAEYGLWNCCDVGHLWVATNRDWMDLCRELFTHCRVVHLHGTWDGKDHLSLAEENPERVLRFADEFLFGYRNVVTIETFNQSDTFGSLEILRKTWERSQS